MRDQRLPNRVRRRFDVPVMCLLSCLLPCLSALVSATALAQVKPYFLVVVDTSGSMAYCANGSSSYLGTNDCSCHTDENDCGSAYKTNRCGFAANRLGDAKCALQRIVDGVGGDAVFALMQFERACDPAHPCQDSDSPGGGACTPGAGGADDPFDDGQLLAQFQPTVSGNGNVREWVDGACSGSCDDMGRELVAGWWTPIGTSLARANQYLRGTSGAGFLYPLGGDVQPASPFAPGKDSALACRKISVILLTDGTDNCGGGSVAAATALRGQPGGVTAADKPFSTYVIGFGKGGDFTPTTLNDIAAAGGTDAPPGGDGRLYYEASDESSLSAALADIVARSMVVEVCNGLDDDCDNHVDEGMPFGQPGSAAQSQALFCDGEGKRSNAQNAQVIARPDYDALAVTDPLTSRVVCGRVRDTCDHAGVDDDCDGKLDEDDQRLNACGQCPGAQEICDGLDNDCDRVIDNAAGSGEAFSVCPQRCSKPVPCGSDVGECQRGQYPCNDGKLDTSVCVGQTLGSVEVCDEKDNDCDGIVDNPADLARVCTPAWGDTGICERGTQYCARPSRGERADATGHRVDEQGNPLCVGAVGPETREVCDELDHDCDGNPFTCTRPTCVSPTLLHVGEACGESGACKGMLVCDTMSQPPRLVCDAPSGKDEVCDGQDNDCDGEVDEDLGPLGPCGSGVGECRPGKYACDADLGKRVCVGAIEAVSEVCDALDNDCDGKVDEGLGLGDACGELEGVCELGKRVCQAGAVVCSGDIPPQTETCDCADNDCDGRTDESSASSPVCPGGSTCTMCQCALPCAPTQEFAAQCPHGKAAVTTDGQCYCVAARCDDWECEQQTIEVGGVAQCAPGSSQVGSCVCHNNACSPRCAGVSCDAGLVCDPTNGRCTQASCLLPQFGCAQGQRCVMADNSFVCQDDPCAGVRCAGDEACREGTCVKSCGSVSCAQGERCVDGACERDRCAAVSCALVPEVCDAASGTCVPAGLCVATGCPDGEVCDAVSGDCREDPCLRLVCPAGERCAASSGQCERICDATQVYCSGQCVNPLSNRLHCGASGDCAGDNQGERCEDGLVCSLGACKSRCEQQLLNCGGSCVDPQSDVEHCGATDSCSGAAAGVHCAEGELCAFGKCRNSASLAQSQVTRGVVATGGGGFGCSVSSVTTRGAGGSGLGYGLSLLALVGLVSRVRRRRHGASLSRLLALAALLLGCAVGSGCTARAFPLERQSAEIGAVAEQADAGVGSTLLRRDAGRGTGRTDAQVVDPTKTPDACLSHELCNEIDDDCDGTIDESPDLGASGIDVQTDAKHCGGCGKACVIAHAFNLCRDGKCVIDSVQGQRGCDVDYVDLDRDPSNGCEYHCVGAAADDKACNLLDDDCDGHIDEDVDLALDVNNCGSCGRACTFAHAASAASCVAGKCVLDSSRCDEGFRDVDTKPGTGCEYRCQGPIAEETCNALDDDCDGNIDESIDPKVDARIGAACGSAVGECKHGVTVCREGAPVCHDPTGPVAELCDTHDNDCDGQTDEDFALMSDKLNCGSCGHVCALDDPSADGHATLVCADGQCQVGACLGNWANANGLFGDGCETICAVTGPEYCDNIDNNCDGRVDADDPELVLPDVLCSGRTEGVCAGHTAEVQSRGPQCVNGKLSCDPARAGITAAEQDETLCDGLDNDCDGKVDEMYPAIGQRCVRGTGGCMTEGVYACAPGGYACNAGTPSAGATETCNGTDDDCNGVVDDFAKPVPGRRTGGVDVVALGGGVLMMAYEASRPDATQRAEGNMTHAACSAADRTPWANVTWGEANAACCALNASGQCSQDNKGWRLCDASTWEAACKGRNGTCTWGYSDTAQVPCSRGAATTAFETICRGIEDTRACPAGGGACPAGDYSDCYARLSGGDVFDMSGNVREWTYTQTNTQEQLDARANGLSVPAVYAIRGGGYSHAEVARTCTFDFGAGDDAFHFPNTGFRCCYYP